LKFIIKKILSGGEVRNWWYRTGFQMVRRCAVRNRLAGAGGHHWLWRPAASQFFHNGIYDSSIGLIMHVVFQRETTLNYIL